MSESVSESPPVVASRRSRRRRRRAGQSGGNKWGIALLILGVVVAGGFFGVKIWIRSYLQSDRFRVWISGVISDRLQAEVNLDRIVWQDSSAVVGTVTATGSAASPFQRAEARDVRATINAGAIWDRVWQVDEIKVARLHLDVSPAPETPPPGPKNSAPASSGDSGGSSSGFLASVLPNRTQVKGVDIDQFGLNWQNGERFAKASGIGLHVKPAEGHGFYLLSGRRGSVNASALPDVPVTLKEFEGSLQNQEFTIDSLSATAADADITAEGTVDAGEAPSVNLKGTVAGLDLAKCLPEDWLKSFKGRADGEVKITGDPRQFDRLGWKGNVSIRNGLLEGLPLLHVIARKTRNEGFVRLQLKEARTEFNRTGDGGWLLEKLKVDALGMLRLKGSVTIAPDDSLNGELLLGIVPGTLRYLAGAEQQVFLPLDQLLVTKAERALMESEDAGLLWTRLKLRGTIDHPQEDLADRLAKAWFNATVDEVLNMSMEGAIKAAENASKAAADVAGSVLEKAPDLLEKGLQTGSDIIGTGLDAGGSLLEKGVEGGLKAVDGLIPGGR